MPRGLLSMSQQEIERTSIIEQVARKQMKQGKAGQILKVGSRQIRRMVRAYRLNGAKGLVSKCRGRVSNNRCEEGLKEESMALIHQHYADFGPTLAAEKLRERHTLLVSKETLRQWMIAAGLWKAKRQKKARVHQSRERRACFGELIQLDGSHHDWFEGRADKCCLLVLIDDATSQLVGLRFEEQETTAGYFSVVRGYVEKLGRPLAFYSDKYGVFRINHPDALGEAQTQFERAMGDLDVELICADSPQAKGRVERANATLQDRLVKEMRLRGISTMAAANAFLPTFIEEYNRRFAVVARSQINAHRQELPDAQTLDLIVSLQYTRTLSKNLELSYENTIYQVKVEGAGYRLQHAKITVCEDLAGNITLLYKGRRLSYQRHEKQKRTASVVSAKQLTTTVNKVVAKTCIPSREHPWRRYIIRPPQGTITESGRSQLSAGYTGRLMDNY